MSKDEAPLELMKQDPDTGLYRLGSMTLTPAEYDIRLTLNKYLNRLEAVESKLIRIEGK